MDTQSRTIKIAVVASYFYPKIGGLENYAYLLAKNLHTSGKYQVSIITSNYDGTGYKKETIDGMTVHRLPIWFKISNTPINPMWYWSIKKIFEIEQPDIVHVHSPVPFMADVAARAAGNRPVVLTYHSGSMLKGKWFIDIFIKLYEKVFLRSLFSRSNAIIAVSQVFAQREMTNFKQKIHVIPPGVELTRFRPSPLPRDHKTIMFIGRIEHSSSWKGIEYLLQAGVIVIKNHPSVTLELIGGGDAIEHYRERARILGIESGVIFPGPLLGQQLIDAYERASVIVLPSTSDSEAFGTVLIEGMASGRPVIASNIGGLPNVITDEKNGLLVPPGDPQALANAIEQVLFDIPLATRLANNGVMNAQSFSWDIQAKKYSELFKSLL